MLHSQKERFCWKI